MKELSRKADFLKSFLLSDSESTGGVIHAFKKQAGCSYQERKEDHQRGRNTIDDPTNTYRESGRKNCRAH